MPSFDVSISSCTLNIIYIYIYMYLFNDISMDIRFYLSKFQNYFQNSIAVFMINITLKAIYFDSLYFEDKSVNNFFSWNPWCYWRKMKKKAFLHSHMVSINYVCGFPPVHLPVHLPAGTPVSLQPYFQYTALKSMHILMKLLI